MITWYEDWRKLGTYIASFTSYQHATTYVANIECRRRYWRCISSISKNKTWNAGRLWITIQKQPLRQFSNISVNFFQEQPFYNFPGGSICSSNRYKFSRRVYMFFEQTLIFQEGLSKRHVFSRRFYLFVEQTLLSHRTDTNFPINSYLVLDHIRIFQEPLFSHRTDTNFPGSPI